MKKLFYFSFAFILSFCLGCSDDDTPDMNFEDVKIEFVNGKIHKPTWLKDVLDDQTITTETGSSFPGEVLGVKIDNKSYIAVTNHLSSNSCIALQLYHLNGEQVDCSSKHQQRLFTEGMAGYTIKTLWSPFDLY